LSEPHRGNSWFLAHRVVLASVSRPGIAAFGRIASLFSPGARMFSRQQACGCASPCQAVSRGVLVMRLVPAAFGCSVLRGRRSASVAA